MREVTVLCGALAHTTVLTARLAPAILHCLLHSFFEQAQHAVQQSGGCIQTLLDDSFVALFGVSGSDEDHAQQAVQAAMQLQQSLSVQGMPHGVCDGEAVTVRLGAHTGTVVGRRLGTDRRLTYIAMGDTIRYAIRLQQLAEPNALLLSNATAQRMQGDVSIAVCGPVHIGLGEQNGQWSHPSYAIHGQQL
jgi:adenylate cyclase